MGTPGDDQAAVLTAAYDQYADAIFRHCYFRVFNRERAKELTQDVFLRTWVYLQRGSEVQNMRAFLYRIANNLVIDESRKRRELSLDGLQEQTGFEPAAVNPRLDVLVDAAMAVKLLERIHPQYREVIVMRYIDGLTPEEISHITDETPNAVSVRLHRAVAAVRKLLPSATSVFTV